MPDVTPKTESRARLLEIMRRMDCQDLFDDAFNALCNYERELRSEAASKAVAEVLAEHRPDILVDYDGVVVVCSQQNCAARGFNWWEVHAALIASERKP